MRGGDQRGGARGVGAREGGAAGGLVVGFAGQAVAARDGRGERGNGGRSDVDVDAGDLAAVGDSGRGAGDGEDVGDRGRVARDGVFAVLLDDLGVGVARRCDDQGAGRGGGCDGGVEAGVRGRLGLRDDDDLGALRGGPFDALGGLARVEAGGPLLGVLVEGVVDANGQQGDARGDAFECGLFGEQTRGDDAGDLSSVTVGVGAPVAAVDEVEAGQDD